MQNRIEYTDNGKLDEVVTDGGAHLESMGGNRWFLECVRKDGSSVAIWITGKVTSIEEREAPKMRALEIHELVGMECMEGDL